jgi:carboxypeptidase family protein
MFVALIAILSLFAVGQQAPPAGMAPPAQRSQPRDPATEKKGTASVKGRVTSSDSGRPLRRVQIRLSAPELTEPRSTSTNLQGAYEFADLPAGRYTISVSRNGYLSLQYGQRRPGEPPKPLQIADGQAVEKLDFTLPRSGVISGRLSDETGDAFAGVAVYAMQTQFFQGRRSLVPVGMGIRSDDAGQYRIVGLSPGEYVVMASIRETWTTDGKEKQVFAYAPSYFPGTANAADATRVKVAVGQEVPAIDISLQPMRAATVSGTALASDGTPLSGGNISLSQEIVGPSGGSFMGIGGTTIGADGSWKLRDMPPGEFQLTARSASSRDRPTETAAMTLVVQGADMEGITLSADPGGTLTGRLVTDDGNALPASRGALRVMGQTTVPGRRSQGVPVGDTNGVVGSAGDFTLKGVSGPSMVRVAPLPPGWAIKSIEVGDKDYVDTPLEITGGRQVDGARIVLSNRFPTLSGQITDEKGNAAEGTVLLFPGDASKWLEAAGTSRSARPDQSGHFKLESVRPGDYLAVALDYVQQWQVNDPEFLEELRDKATKVTLEEGQSAQLALKIKK